jgi:hypothetical protein
MLTVDPHSRAHPDVHREALGVIPRSSHSPVAAQGHERPYR